MILNAISNPDKAVRQAAVLLGLAALTILGVIWLTIGLVQTLMLWMPPAAASAVMGGGLVGGAASVFWLRALRKPDQTTDAPKTSEGGDQDLLTRGTHLAERLAPDSPMLALTVAIGTGWASVSCPPTLDSVIRQIFASLEPEGAS